MSTVQRGGRSVANSNRRGNGQSVAASGASAINSKASLRGSQRRGPGGKRNEDESGRPYVGDPDDPNIDRTPQPLSAVAAAAIAAAVGKKQQQGGVGTSMMGSQMGSQMMTSGVGMSIQQSAAMSATELDSVGSQFKAYGDSQGASSGMHSQVSGSLMSSMGGSVLSAVSDGSALGDTGVTSLAKKSEVPKAVDVMKAQQAEEVAALTPAQLDSAEKILFRETPMFMILDIKSQLVRKDAETEMAEVEAGNTKYEELKELKITAADNYAGRGIQTNNLIMKTKQVQEAAPASVTAAFQATEWDIYDRFFVEGEDDDGGAEDDLKMDDKDLPAAPAEGSQVGVSQSGDASTMGASGVSGNDESTMVGSSIMPSGSIMQSGTVGMSTMAPGGSTFYPGMPGATDPAQVQNSMNAKLPGHLTEKMRVLERMVMQNVYAKNHLHYSGFDIPSELSGADGDADAEGGDEDEDEDEDEDDEEWDDDDEVEYRLDKQWHFECDLTTGCNVSGLSWSKKPKYEHVLAVSYGETDFESAQKGGAILIWSLKNPEHPDHVIETPTGVMCIAFSHTHHNLLAAGMYDGTVCVYDIGRRDKKPFLESGYLQKHTGPVWELRWVDQNSDRGEKLVSISSDGRITQWTMKKGLDHTDLFKLKKVPNPAKQKDVKSEAFISRNASGFCFDFSPADAELYLCGTEEGNIHLCSRLYNHFLRNYEGHTEPVYRVKYCPYHPGIFLSASADWTVKLWQSESTKALMSIQPGNTPCMDICWSPAKPTVFGATTSDGKLLVYDLQQNQMEPSTVYDIGDPSIHMNSLAFADGSPVVMSGTSSGSVAAFTIHGLMSANSGPVMADPVKQLESILMMGKETVTTSSEVDQ